jgi:hypothetical protein
MGHVVPDTSVQITFVLAGLIPSSQRRLLGVAGAGHRTGNRPDAAVASQPDDVDINEISARP